MATHNKPFSCPVCSDSFLVEFLLDRHLETHHRACLDHQADVAVPPPPPVASTLPSVLTCLALDAAAAASVLYSQVIPFPVGQRLSVRLVSWITKNN